MQWCKVWKVPNRLISQLWIFLHSFGEGGKLVDAKEDLATESACHVGLGYSMWPREITLCHLFPKGFNINPFFICIAEVCKNKWPQMVLLSYRCNLLYP